MKTNTKTAKEIVVTARDKIGVLSRISTVISESEVNVRAVCAYEVDGIVHLRLITDDNERARDALGKAGFDATEHNVIVAEVSPHSVHPEVESFVDNISTGNNYWCASAHNGEHAVIVFSPAEGAGLSAVR